MPEQSACAPEQYVPEQEVVSGFSRTVVPKRVLVTGARGQLAGAIVEAYKDSAQVLAYSREELDIADFDAVMSEVEAARPDLIFNCASFNHVDRAETEPRSEER